MFTSEKELVIGVFVAAITFFIFAILIVLLVYNYFRVKSRRDLEILRAVFEAQENDRNRIANDLHDDIGGKLSALKLLNELFITESPSAPLADHARKTAGIIDSLVRDIRSIVRNQASRYITENGLKEELERLCDRFREAAGLKIGLEIHLPVAPEPMFAVALFRMVQELLHNTVKHAAATVVDIRLTQEPRSEAITLSYSDNGTGFIPGDSDGMGLGNIRTRARGYNGTLSLQSAPGKGTKVTIVF